MVETENKSLAFNEKQNFLPWMAVLSFVILTAFQLHNQDRIRWCKLGDYALWSSDAWGKHNSQHFLDPYSFTHLLHGVLFFWLISLIFRKTPLVWQFTLAIFVECAWEILENTNQIIEHYRTATLALEYYGDSIANSLGDILSSATGFILARKLKFPRSLILFLFVEATLLIWIHDSLLLNIVMLIHPIEAVKAWQNQ